MGLARQGLLGCARLLGSRLGLAAVDWAWLRLVRLCWVVLGLIDIGMAWLRSSSLYLAVLGSARSDLAQQERPWLG